MKNVGGRGLEPYVPTGDDWISRAEGDEPQRSYRTVSESCVPLTGDRQFESVSLQRRVRLLTGTHLPRSRNAAFRAGVRAARSADARPPFVVARSIIHMHPRQMLFSKHMSRWLQFGRAIERADVEMRFSR